MADSRRPGEITYYEELGVEKAASAEAIRDAFRSLVRIIHPDQQTDPQLKEVAERQMRKLNRIYDVLSDPTRRAAYDQSLRNARTPPVIVFRGSDGSPRSLFVLGAIAAGILSGMFLLIWFAIDSAAFLEARGQQSAISRSGDTNDGDAGEQITRLRAKLRTAERERDSALLQLGRLRQGTAEGASPGRAGSATAAGTTKPTANSPTADPIAFAHGTAAASGPGSGGTQANQFAGVWTYTRPDSAAAAGGDAKYSPDFAEVTVIEVNGALHGRYRSAYQTPDHAMTPEVNFDFTGVPHGSTLNCAWNGQDGAKGRMTLTLLPDRDVSISWNATKLGNSQWLPNGTALLSKQ
jgi:curved DNA-binding protein CbpA